jgi:hypothetical protein
LNRILSVKGRAFQKHPFSFRSCSIDLQEKTSCYIGLSVLIDSWFWQCWLWSEDETLYFNTMLNKSSHWSVCLKSMRELKMRFSLFLIFYLNRYFLFYNIFIRFYHKHLVGKSYETLSAKILRFSAEFYPLPPRGLPSPSLSVSVVSFLNLIIISNISSTITWK